MGPSDAPSTVRQASGQDDRALWSLYLSPGGLRKVGLLLKYPWAIETYLGR